MVTQKLAAMVESRNSFIIQSKRKAVTAFFPYAVGREQDGDHRMMDAFLGAVRAAGSTMHLWRAIRPFIPTLFKQASPQTIVLTSPHVPWHSELRDENVVFRWAAAASEITYTDDIDRSVVDALLHIASIDSLRPQIPTGIWTWLNKRPSLPPVCFGRSMGTKRNVVCRVRELGDTEILKSYLLTVWSEWDYIVEGSSRTEMQISIREDFSGIGLGHHRKDLVEQLDHVLRQLDRGSGYLKQSKLWIDEDDVRRAKRQYQMLKEVLVEVDKEAIETLTRTCSKLIGLFHLPTPIIVTVAQNPTRRSLVPSLSHVRSCLSATFAPVPQLRTSFVHGFRSLRHFVRFTAFPPPPSYSHISDICSSYLLTGGGPVCRATAHITAWSLTLRPRPFYLFIPRIRCNRLGD